jgi:ribonuclease E
MQNDSNQNESNQNHDMHQEDGGARASNAAEGFSPASQPQRNSLDDAHHDVPVDLDPPTGDMSSEPATEGHSASRVGILDELADAPEPELSDEERAALELEAQEAAADADESAAAYARASMRDFDKPAEETQVDGDEPVMVQRERPKQLVVVNDVPGDEMRIAILEQGKLAQFYGERASNTTNVGSIYKARVVNVEPAIQAAFVDFGEGANGFLHISDLHPKYFPGAKREGGERTEKVGRKIPRRSRPMMQEALKRGQEITVQVLKEGLGSKGPTVTSYLSIPGRLLVMMPDMDNVGVSRKVDDEEGRRKMRKILDSLNLPEGFGFILRTAGFDSTRTELARDAQYLTRLWQVMEKRMNAVGAPCQLYTEGDILLRTIRDSIDASVDGIVVDSEPAFHRAKAFLEVVAPKAAARVHYYDRRMPVFHAFDVERQVDTIHSREVPLPSGGALVIDQAEALVAIDVNSGRSRSARDSETNAYQTNQEAVDEIARQLRLRDLGGVVICDLIDMRSAKHRRDIEDRLKKNLARDRAKTTVSQISEFGIVELTRQRMRPSIRKAHYIDCPHCAGHGEIRMPDSVAADAVRRVQLVLDMEKVSRLELVCSSKVAAVLLSTKRRVMDELEDLFAKKIAVRISEAIAVDRVDIYAYDDRGADVELDRPQRVQIPALSSLPIEIEDDADGSASSSRGEQRGDQRGDGGEGGGGGRRGRRRRRRKPAAADATSIILSGGFDDLPELDDDEPSISDTLADSRDDDAEDGDDAEGTGEGAKQGERSEEGEGGRRGRGRRRRRGRGRDRESGSRGSEQGSQPQLQQQQQQQRPTRATRPVAPPPPPREPSEPIRVHAIAKEIELTSKEVLAKCAELGIEVKGHQSLLTGEQGDEVRKAYGKPPFDVPEPTPEPEATDDFDAESGEGTDGERATGAEGEPGEGGRRKRRRRRRRSRGGRGQDGEAAPSDDAEGSDASASNESQSEGESSEGDDADGEQSDGERSDGERSDGEQSDGEGAPEGDGSGNREDGGRRRRRRRRGGRGRNREAGGGGDGASTGGAVGVGNSNGGESRSEPRSEPRNDQRRDGNRDGNRGGNRDGNRGGNRDRNRDGNRGGNRGGNSGEGRDGNRGESRAPAAPQQSAPAPAPAPTPAPAPRPRSLYGGRVRKLAPGERPKGGGDE